MPSEAVQAMSEEIDAAVEEISTAQAAGQELVSEEVGETEEDLGEVEVGPHDGYGDDDVTEEAEEAEETTSEESVSGDGDREEAERSEATPTHGEHVIERAVAAGIPVVDANALTSASLERVISAREQAYAEQNVLPASNEKDQEKDPFDQLPELDPDKYEPEVIAAVEGLRDIARAQQKEIREYHERAEQTQEIHSRESMRELENWFDGQVNGLGEDFVDALGAGGYSSLGQG
ncbi:MAG: hypothetical protein NWE89_00870, partial [Candidatus Bathyarchaeota archaeon]|nr:hypothetical protein [Candidatus Bathyarchaeota archaeon]